MEIFFMLLFKTFQISQLYPAFFMIMRWSAILYAPCSYAVNLSCGRKPDYARKANTSLNKPKSNLYIKGLFTTCLQVKLLTDSCRRSFVFLFSVLFYEEKI